MEQLETDNHVLTIDDLTIECPKHVSSGIGHKIPVDFQEAQYLLESLNSFAFGRDTGESPDTDMKIYLNAMAGQANSKKELARLLFRKLKELKGYNNIKE